MGRHALPALWLEEAGEETFDVCRISRAILVVIPAIRMPDEDQWRLWLLRPNAPSLRSNIHLRSSAALFEHL
jgi:hypothetical protein